jgi:ABC-type nitrate/sulfonate/bicarbonate transport system permease component
MSSIKVSDNRVLEIVENISSIKVGFITLPRLLGVITAILTWYYVGSIFPNDLLPFPVEVIQSSYDLVESGIVWRHLWDTIARTFWGFGGAMLVGIIVGVLMGINDYSQKFSLPYVIIGLSIPGIAWAAIMTIIFGIEIKAPVAAVIATTFPYIAINVWKGVESIEADLVKMSQSFNIPPSRMLFRLILPSAAPALFTAFRFGLAISWKVETNAEVFASASGIGFKTIQAYQSFNYVGAWAWALVFIVIIIAVEYTVFRPLERRVFNFRQDADVSLL